MLETTPDTFWSLFAGYAVIWAFVVFFLVRLMLEQSALKKRLSELEKLLGQRQ